MNHVMLATAALTLAMYPMLRDRVREPRSYYTDRARARVFLKFPMSHGTRQGRRYRARVMAVANVRSAGAEIGGIAVHAAIFAPVSGIVVLALRLIVPF